MDLQHFVGLPYVPNGRDYHGADCWGVVFLFYRDVLRQPIPAYSAEMDARSFCRKDIGTLVDVEKLENWARVDLPHFGDCVLMRNGHVESHVGIFLGDDRILHSEGDAGSLIERADGKRLRHRIVGYYRLKHAH
jgi:cell wall-associated NlpC family hydrolase